MIKPGAVYSLEPPLSAQQHLADIGGKNLYGEPRYRLVWSGNRLAWSNRKWTEGDGHGNVWSAVHGWRYAPKYTQPARRERFIVEVFRPAEFYGSPDSWYLMNTKYVDGHLLLPSGPYPARGEYEYLDTVEYVDDDGERHYLEPTAAYVDMVVTLHKKLVATTESELLALKEAEETKRKEANYNRILEQVKNTTSPLAFKSHAVIANTAALEGSADYMARNATVPAVQ